MSNHPGNLALRFLLELFSVLFTIGLPVLAAALWGTFRVPDDPGKAPVAIPGYLRLLLEASYFNGAVGALYAAGRANWGLVFAFLVLIHYLLSYDRVVWLLRQ